MRPHPRAFISRSHHDVRSSGAHCKSLQKALILNQSFPRTIVESSKLLWRSKRARIHSRGRYSWCAEFARCSRPRPPSRCTHTNRACKHQPTSTESRRPSSAGSLRLRKQSRSSHDRGISGWATACRSSATFPAQCCRRLRWSFRLLSPLRVHQCAY